MGIIAISMLTMLGLVPVGLAGMRSAMTETVRAQIIQNITSQALLVGFSKIDKDSDPAKNLVTNKPDAANSKLKDPYYFEDQGRQQYATDQSPPPNTNTRYKVTVTRMDATVYPGSSNGSKSDMFANVATLKIKIEVLKSLTKPETYTVLVPNQGN